MGGVGSTLLSALAGSGFRDTAGMVRDRVEHGHRAW
jgi:hypothetical protein